MQQANYMKISLIYIICLGFIFSNIIFCSDKNKSKDDLDKDQEIISTGIKSSLPEDVGTKPHLKIPTEFNKDKENNPIIKQPKEFLAKSTLETWLKSRINGNWNIYTDLIEPDFYTSKYGELENGKAKHLNKVSEIGSNLKINSYNIGNANVLSDDEISFKVAITATDNSTKTLNISVVLRDNSWYISKLTF